MKHLSLPLIAVLGLPLAACAPILQDTSVTPGTPNVAYAESYSDTPQAQRKAMHAAQLECGRQGLDVFPDNSKSDIKLAFGKVGYNLVFTCAKMSPEDNR